MKKLVIGSANFNQEYGLQKSKISKKNLRNQIFKIIRKFNLKYFDTAIDYNLPKSFFKSVNFKKIKIITKIKLSKNQNHPQVYERQILKEIDKFQVKSLEYVLLHNPNDLKTKEGFQLIKTLKRLKRKKLIKKLGVSIYQPKDLKFILKKFNPDLVQVPLNVFDIRFIKSNYFKLIKKKNIEIQARSIFLQGLLLKNDAELKKLKAHPELIKKIKFFENWCLKNNISRLSACISFVKQLKGVELITTGFNTPQELLQIIKEFNTNKKILIKNFSIRNQNIIDPRKW